MRWDISEAVFYKWRRWFAWHPVTIGQQRVWLETVERRESLCSHEDWEYRHVA